MRLPVVGRVVHYHVADAQVVEEVERALEAPRVHGRLQPEVLNKIREWFDKDDNGFIARVAEGRPVGAHVLEVFRRNEDVSVVVVQSPPLGRFSGLWRRSFGVRRAARDDEQHAHLRETRDDVVGQPVGKELLLRIVVVLDPQHGEEPVVERGAGIARIADQTMVQLLGQPVNELPEA